MATRYVLLLECSHDDGYHGNGYGCNGAESTLSTLVTLFYSFLLGL